MTSTQGPGARVQMFTHQANAHLSQAAAVQNTWYTILATSKNVLVLSGVVIMRTTGEDIAIRNTIDSQVVTGGYSANADTWYGFFLGSVDGGIVYSTSYDGDRFPFYGRSIKSEMRKTTANGAGTLEGRLVYQQVT